MNNPDLEYIKKYYSETFAHICRELFPTVLEYPKLLPQLIEKNFAHSKNLGQDILEQDLKGSFQSFILSQIPKIANLIPPSQSQKTATELFDEAGYILYPECKTESDIQNFRHYYKRNNDKTPVYIEGQSPVDYEDEELCTFGGDRLSYCRVWFAVKKNVDDIKRENFTHPQRQDAYGTSVISIQFTKKRGELSIKNRYNHTVDNPDATYSNNLDNIISGLSHAFERDFGIRQTSTYASDFSIDSYFYADNGKYYRENMRDSDNIYCENNTIISNKNGIVKLPNDQLLIDCFVLDLKNKTFKPYNSINYDILPDTIGNIQKIEIVKNGKNKEIIITNEEPEKIKIVINSKNQIIKYVNNNIAIVDDYFMSCSEYLQELEMQNLFACGDYFVYKNQTIKKLNLPNLKSCADFFLYNNNGLTSIDLPNLKKCGDAFLLNNNHIQSVSLPNLEVCGISFLAANNVLKELSLMNLKECGNSFMETNETIKNVFLPKLEVCGNDFLYSNCSLTKLDLPSLVSCKEHFLSRNKIINSLNMPSLQNCGSSFLLSNKGLDTINLPVLTYCGHRFLYRNEILCKLNLPKLISIGNDFLYSNIEIKKLSLPNLKYVESGFFEKNYYLTFTNINLPKIDMIYSQHYLNKFIIRDMTYYNNNCDDGKNIS